MPWCPKCEVEYREGFTVCSDCKTELIEELEKPIELVPFLETEKEALAKRLIEYFKYSKLNASYSLDESTGNYVVLIPEDQQKSAFKHYKAFLIVEESLAEEKKESGSADETDEVTAEEIADQEDGLNEDQQEAEDQDEEDEIPLNNSKPYVMKEDRYKDNRSTGLMFLLFGLAGIIFVVLNYLEIFNVVNNLFQYIIFTALFIGFIVVSISSYQSAKKLKPEIEVENQLTKEINAWLSTHITKEYYDSIYKDDISEEINYIAIFDHIKGLVLREFGQQEISYIDRLIDEYYDRTF